MMWHDVTLDWFWSVWECQCKSGLSKDNCPSSQSNKPPDPATQTHYYYRQTQARHIFWQSVSSRTIPVPKTLSDTTRKACILFSYSTLSCSHNRDDLVLLELLTNNLRETLRVPPKRKQTSPTSALNKKNRRPCWVRPRRDWRIFAGPSCVSYNYTIIIYYIYYKYYKYID